MWREGYVGVGSDNARGVFNNVDVQVLPPQLTFEQTVDFEDGLPELFTGWTSGDWQVIDGLYRGTPASGSGYGVSMVDLGLEGRLLTTSFLELSATLNTEAAAGFIFDNFGPDEFKFVALDAGSQQLLIGYHTAKRGWMVEAAVARPIQAGVDYELTLSLKGTTVSASVGGQVLLGHVFNSVVVTGDFGLLSLDGSTSFESMTVRANDPALDYGIVSDSRPASRSHLRPLGSPLHRRSIPSPGTPS